jgi:hypothetical protein
MALQSTRFITDFLERIQDKALPTFSLADMEGFPYEEYSKNLERYTEMESWFDGTALDETVQQDGEEVDLYPVKLNPLPGTVEKHTHFLFGQVSQDDRPLVSPRGVAFDDSEESRTIVEQVENLLAQTWWENNGRALQWESGSGSQIYGGCIWHVIYDPYDKMRSVPIRLETVHPKYFVGLPKANDMWSLQEAWIVQPITHKEAASMGVDIPEEEAPWLITHYTMTDMDIWINNKPAFRFIDGEGWKPMSGANPWGMVPVVYLPHTRVMTFYGQNVIDILTGIIKEMNLRVADYGDAVTVDAHAYVATRNVHGAPTVQTIAPNLKVINLGTNQSYTGHDTGDPDIIQVRNATASSPMKDLVEMLYAIYRRLATLPSVVDGEDEGSQRSGLTLAMRMIALTSHTEAERVFWTAGLVLVNRLILRMLLVANDARVTIRHATTRLKLEWAPILPRDREMIVEEAVTLMAAKLGSPERLLEILGVDDVSKEKDLILDFWKEISDMAAEVKERQLAKSSSSAQKGTKAKGSK